MAKKRKTYYLDESTIQQVKQYAQELNLSENDAFERAVEVFEKFYYNADQYLPLPAHFTPLLLEAVDNLIYNSKRVLETLLPNEPRNENIHGAIEMRIQHLYEIRKLLLPIKE
jgi:hypothetical protein